MTASRSVLYGPPGTGKTTALLDIVDRELASGTSPTRIAFLSFTRKATEEARDRAIERFGFDKKELPWFRTIHSLAFNRLGLRRDEVMGPKAYRQVGEALGLTFSGRHDEDEGLPTGRHKGDRYAFLDGFSRARCIRAEEAFRLCVDPTDSEDLDWWEFRRFRYTLARYKDDNGLVDFSDMLELDQAPLDVDAVIVDEAQDLSTAQHAYLERTVFPYAKRIYVAGDDDQAIFQWSGADVRAFQQMPGERTVLNQSHRVPRQVHRAAERISRGIRARCPKAYRPKAEEGLVKYHLTPDTVDLSEGSWLLLARNAHLLNPLVALVRGQGLPYCYRGESAVSRRHVDAIRAWERRRRGEALDAAELELVASMAHRGARPELIWHEALALKPQDREWYISILRRGESLTKPPRINISTIHGVKGGEADNVLLLSDMSARTWAGYQRDEDGERRCWYVGVTRARRELHVVQPMTGMGFDI